MGVRPAPSPAQPPVASGRCLPIIGALPSPRAIGLSALIGACILTLPRAGYPLTPYAEYEYQAAMIVALRNHLQWGSQVVWTYGPYGYLNEPAFMDFNTWLVAFMANLAGHLALFGLLAYFLWRIQARPWLFMLLSAVILLTFDRYTGQEFQRFAVLDQKTALIVILLLFLATEAASERRAAMFAGVAGALIAYLFLDKGTFMLAGGGIVAVYLALSLGRKRIASAAALLGGFVLSFCGLWLFAAQSIAGIPSYFRTSFEIIAGYTPAMSLFLESGASYPDVQSGIGLAMLSMTVLLLLSTAWRRDWSTFRLLLLSSPLMFFVYKNAFVRFNEAHAVGFWALVAVLLSLVLARVIVAPNGVKLTPPAVLAGLTALACIALVSGLGPLIGGVSDMRPTFPFPENLASYRHAGSLLVRPDRRLQEEAQVRASLQAAYPLPPGLVARLNQETVDCVPLDLQMCLAYDFNWDPQPVLQSYNAWSPYLDRIDAQHYMGPSAPRFVLFAAATIDGRYPLYDEPETYRVLMDNYRVVDHVSFVLVLERRDDLQQPEQHSAGNVTGGFGDWIEVPSHRDQRLYGRVQVTYSPLGQTLGLLHRPPELHIIFKYGGGQVSRAYRFVPAVAPDGLDLSSYAPDTESAGRLAQGQFDQPIEAIRIVTESPADAYQPVIRVDYFTQPVT